MLNIRQQTGMTMWSIIIVIMLGMFFLLLAFKILPAYYDDSKIGNAIESVANRPGAGLKTSSDLKESIEKMFSVDYISADYLIKEIKILPQGPRNKIISLEYEVEIELMGNLSALLYFEHEYKAR